MRALRPSAICTAFALLVGCAPNAQGGALDATEQGAAGQVLFRLQSQGPLLEGSNDLRLQTARLDNAAAADGSISVSVVMPSMGHHAIVGGVSRSAPGDFWLEGVVISMPGAWELGVTLAGEVEDEATFVLEIQ